MGRRKKDRRPVNGIFVSRNNANRIMAAVAEALGHPDPVSAVADNYPILTEDVRAELNSRGLVVPTRSLQGFAAKHCRQAHGTYLWSARDVDDLGEQLAADGSFNKMSQGLYAAGRTEDEIVEATIASIKGDPVGVATDAKEVVQQKIGKN